MLRPLPTRATTDSMESEKSSVAATATPRRTSLGGVPNYVDRETRKADFKLEPGLTLAVEPMVNMRRPEVDTLGDQWTVVTRDRLASVHVEHTLALTANGVTIITSDEGAFEDEP